MRIAIVSDIHGNYTAFEAVLADLRAAVPDLVLHGGDLADSGSSPVHIVDRIRELGWRGVCGNTDEMLTRPAGLERFAAQSKAPPALWGLIRAIAAATRDALGEERLAWLGALGDGINVGDDGNAILLHGSARSCWYAPSIEASEEDLLAAFDMGKEIVIYGHTHVPGVRRLGVTCPGLVINSGSVGLPCDGDRRASYLLLDNGVPAIRRVAYDLDRELQLLAACGLPGAAWTARTLKAGAATMP